MDLSRGLSAASTLANDVWSTDSGFGKTRAQIDPGDAKESRESQRYGSGSGVGA